MCQLQCLYPSIPIKYFGTFLEVSVAVQAVPPRSAPRALLGPSGPSPAHCCPLLQDDLCELASLLALSSGSRTSLVCSGDSPGHARIRDYLQDSWVGSGLSALLRRRVEQVGRIACEVSQGWDFTPASSSSLPVSNAPPAPVMQMLSQAQHGVESTC